MMNEQPPELTKKPEFTPTVQEVSSLFAQLLHRAEHSGRYETERRFEDEKGLYLWTIKAFKAGEPGYAEYEYIRQGQYAKRDGHGPIQAAESVINVTFYDERGMPFAGHSTTKCFGGRLVITS